ncbi:MAG: prephenate dehydratase [Nocardioidaceae bacterium]
MPGVPPTRFAYLGPRATFTEQALRTIPAARKATLLPAASVPDALDAVRHGDADSALVPLENSVEGSVAVTLDELATGEPLVITREVLLPVGFSLLARPGTALPGVRTLATHPHAAAQCRNWLRDVLPQAAMTHVLSTADAARAVARGDFDAALAAPVAGEHYRLAALAEDVGDVADAVTRFVLVSRPGTPSAPTGDDKTSLVVFTAHDHAGALQEVLTEFAVRGINLTRIESRPTRQRLGSYHFLFDCAGHVADARVGEALAGLRRRCADVRFLGSYPRVGEPGRAAGRGEGCAEAFGQGPAEALGQIHAGFDRDADADFADAAAWLAHVREGRTA